MYGVLSGAGITADAYHMTAPTPGGAGQIAAMRKALRQAGLSPGEIGHVNAHATGTPVGDVAEGAAIREKLKQGRGIAARSDKTARSFHAGLSLAATLQWVSNTR
ncbi:hypothetical protein [Arthrobacter bambusae]|uniref:3-oxoacyl-(Acyl-carrier-protein) synthase n=1 Tax=Arthrobacter bambusae TaxID=1338426 RepID=A0AAW8D9V4_9MICC|nr:hypothetical protein [Arthrobacter bambusae]MDP9904583.1 3-oxoacyl-(acyl-carrier-protein) synthase [Arthrobacter bambusae]MDQ0129399.1 3-oxoacyl-(acyl-carrier-protein) synthase [Arthrobacter bambusae]MDQ0180988.1 3-oxoacyl-(acyl-carrier-protein) synthase [Arthrobacter bambusae]